MPEISLCVETSDKQLKRSHPTLELLSTYVPLHLVTPSAVSGPAAVGTLGPC